MILMGQKRSSYLRAGSGCHQNLCLHHLLLGVNRFLFGPAYYICCQDIMLTSVLLMEAAAWTVTRPACDVIS